MIQGSSAAARLGRVLRVNSTSAWLPVVLGAAILAAVCAVAIVTPASVRGPAVLGTAAAAFVLAYIPWPKPALLLFALFVLFYHTVARWLTPELRHVDEIVVPLLFIAALVRTRPWRHNRIDPLREGALLVMFVAAIGSSVINAAPANVWPLGLLLLAKGFAFLYVCLWHDFHPRDLRQLYPLVLGIGIVVLALVPIEVLAPERFQEVLNLSTFGVPREGLPSIKSVFYRPVLFAWFSAFVGLYLVAGYVVLRRPLLLLGAALFGIGTILAGRRRAIAAVGAALLGGIAADLIGHRSWRTSARGWGPVVAGALLVSLVFSPSLLGLVAMTVDPGNSADQARSALYQTSVVIARDEFPLGVGLGRYGSALSRDPYSPVYARYGLDKIDGLSPKHSSFVGDTFWPRILGETGVIGLIALLVFTAVLGVQIWRATRGPTLDGVTRAFLLGTWMVFVAALVETLASSMFDSPPRIYLLFGAVGVALSLVRSTAAEASNSERSSVEA